MRALSLVGESWLPTDCCDLGAGHQAEGAFTSRLVSDRIWSNDEGKPESLEPLAPCRRRISFVSKCPVKLLMDRKEWVEGP